MGGEWALLVPCCYFSAHFLGGLGSDRFLLVPGVLPAWPCGLGLPWAAALPPCLSVMASVLSVVFSREADHFLN